MTDLKPTAAQVLEFIEAWVGSGKPFPARRTIEQAFGLSEGVVRHTLLDLLAAKRIEATRTLRGRSWAYEYHLPRKEGST